ncbi:MAG: Ig-like domain-containing protein [Bacilli bacterium]|nr:Ig-like domain-containing protein [Bacilli bacterium]
MKKKLLIPFAVLAAFMGLSACGGNNQTESKAPGVSTSASEKNEIKITFSKANKKLTKGEKGTFTSSVEGVTWSSDNTAVATIDDKGEVTAIGEGKAVIKASKEGYKDATETITVVLKKIVITAAGNKTALTIGEEVQLSADVTGVTWTTSDNKLATVDGTGKVKALAAGSVTISAQAEGYTKGSISLEIARPAANATFDFLTDADHYSADGWWELANTGGFSMETSEGFTPKMTPMSWGQQTEESDPYIGGFDVGDKETIKFNSNKANSAEFLVNIGNADEIALADVMSVKLNGAALDLSNITLPAHEGQYGNSLTFEDVSFGNATLINGENTLVFEFLASGAPRLNTLAVYAGDATVAVVAPAAKSQIAVNEAKLSVIEGEDVQIVTTEAGVTYTSVNPETATVDNTGKVHGVAVGITNITVSKAGMYSVRVEITVNPKPVAGQIIVEAEDAEEIKDGSVSGVNVNTDGAGGFGGSNTVHSGGKYINAWQASDVTLTYKWNVDSAKTMGFSIVGAAPMSFGGEASAYVFANSMTMTLNNAAFDPAADAQFAAPQGWSSTMEEVALGNVNLIDGENTLTIAFSGSFPSLDCFKFSLLS